MLQLRCYMLITISSLAAFPNLFKLERLLFSN